MHCAMLYLVFSCSCVGICVLMDQRGYTTLMSAAENGHLAVVECLVWRGAGMEAQHDVSAALYLVEAHTCSAMCNLSYD